VKTRVLLVMLPQRRTSLVRILEQNGMEVVAAGDFLEAQEKLEVADSYDLVFVDADLPGGSWKMLLQDILDSRCPCEIIVCSRIADEHLWAEVLQCGAYDLVGEPYDERQVADVAHNALHSRHLQRFARVATQPAPDRMAS